MPSCPGRPSGGCCSQDEQLQVGWMKRWQVKVTGALHQALLCWPRASVLADAGARLIPRQRQVFDVQRDQWQFIRREEKQRNPLSPLRTQPSKNDCSFLTNNSIIPKPESVLSTLHVICNLMDSVLPYVIYFYQLLWGLSVASPTQGSLEILHSTLWPGRGDLELSWEMFPM